MRLGIKGKQVLGVTSIVGAVVVVLSLMHLARLAHGQPRREPGARGAAWPTPSSTAPATSSPTTPIRTRRCAPIPACARFSSRACYSKNVTFAAIVDAARHRRRARRPVAGRAAAAGRAPICGELLTRSPFCQLRAIYSRPGTQPRIRAAAAARRHRVRLDPHRRLDAADPPGSRRVAAAGGGRPRCSRSASRCSARCCSRSCCCGRFT